MIKNALLGLAKAYARQAGRDSLAWAARKTRGPYNRFAVRPARRIANEIRQLPTTLNPRRILHGIPRRDYWDWRLRNPSNTGAPKSLGERTGNPIDIAALKSLGKWTGGAATGGGLMALTGSPTENPLTYGGGTAAALAAFLLSRGRIRFPVTMGAGLGGAYWGNKNDVAYKIQQAEKARLERNKKSMSNLMRENEFLHGSPFGTDPRDSRYSRKQYHDINREQHERMRESQQARPDYDEIDFPWWGSRGSDALYGE